MKNVVVWGLGNNYGNLLELLKKYDGKLRILACVDRNKVDSKGIPIVESKQLKKIQFDYLIISTDKYYWEIFFEAVNNLGIEAYKIVKWNIFLDNDFDLTKYEKEGWLNNHIINNCISENEYVEFEKKCKAKNGIVSIGKMSSIAKARIEDGGNPGKFNIVVGNYTNIGWDVVFEMGLNLDHDYNRVLNYGFTHLFDDYKMNESNKYCISIQNDVWIGKGVKIKSGIKIGNGAVVASNSVVVCDVPPYAIVGGNPAKIIKYRFPEDIIEELQRIAWWEWPANKLREYKEYLDSPKDFINKLKE